MTCLLRDGTVETKRIDTDNTSGTTVTVNNAFSSDPLQAAFIRSAPTVLKNKSFGAFQWATMVMERLLWLLAVEFNDSIYAAAESNNEELEFIDVTAIDQKTAQTRNLMPIEFQLITKNGKLTNRGNASWSRGDGGFTASFDVRYRIDKGSFKKINTTDTSLSVDGIKPGKTLEVQVRAVGIGFPVKKSAYAKATGVAPSLPKKGKDKNDKTIEQVVPNVQNLSLNPINEKEAILTWNPPANEKLEPDCDYQALRLDGWNWQFRQCYKAYSGASSCE